MGSLHRTGIDLICDRKMISLRMHRAVLSFAIALEITQDKSNGTQRRVHASVSRRALHHLSIRIQEPQVEWVVVCDAAQLPFFKTQIHRLEGGISEHDHPRLRCWTVLGRVAGWGPSEALGGSGH